MLEQILQRAVETPGIFRMNVRTYAKKPAATSALERQRGQATTLAAKKMARELQAKLTFGTRAYVRRRLWGEGIIKIHAPYSGHTQMARRVTWHELAHATYGYKETRRFMGLGHLSPSGALEEVRAELAALAMLLHTEEQVEERVLKMSLNYISHMARVAELKPETFGSTIEQVKLIVKKLKEVANAYES